VGLNERLSAQFPVIPDERPHTYIVDLHAGAGPGAVNYLWWHPGNVNDVRLDPLDAPGEFSIALAGFAHQDAAGSEEVRERLKLPALRTELSYRYLRGSGVEIGALQSPLQVRPDAYIRYADRLTVDEARAHYPELDPFPLVTPSIICDAAALAPVADSSVDFVVANHVLEHLRDPLAALREWLRVVRAGGHLYIAVPDHNNVLDRLRPITPVEHLIADFEERPERLEADRSHYREWVASTRPHLSQEEQDEQQAHLESTGYAIHFHTFTRDTFAALMDAAAVRFQAEPVELRQGSTGEQTEYIAILRRL
jgi:SAM-dependent methyltransferase